MPLDSFLQKMTWYLKLRLVLANGGPLQKFALLFESQTIIVRCDIKFTLS